MYKLGIILGGNDDESNLSIHSARFIFECLCEEKNFQLYFIFTEKHDNQYIFYKLESKFLYCNTIKDFAHIEKDIFDFNIYNLDLLIPVIHGEFGEGGELMNMIEKYNIPHLFTDSEHIKNMFFKYQSGQILKQYGFNKNYIQYYEKIDDIYDNSKLFIIKPNNSGSSYKINVTNYENINNYDLKGNLIEEFLSGQEFTHFVLNGISQGTIILKHRGDYITYKHKNFPSDLEIEHINNIQISADSERIYNIFECKHMMRIDGFITNKGIIYTDINPIPSLDFNSFTWCCCENDISTNIFKKFLYNYFNIQYIEQNNNKILLPVIFGGNSSEAYISHISAASVCIKLLNSDKYEPLPMLLEVENDDIYVYKIPINKLFYHNLKGVKKYKTSKYNITDLYLHFQKVFLALHGGIGEDGTIQNILDHQKIKYNGENYTNCNIFIDKMKTVDMISDFNIPNIKIQKQHTIFPGHKCIMKPRYDGSSASIFIVESQAEVNNIIKQLNNNLLESIVKPNIMEFFFEDIIPWPELTVTYAFGEVFTPSETVKDKILSAEDKFLNGYGTNITPPNNLSDNDIQIIKDTILKVMTLFNVQTYCRIDFFYHNGQLIILEINTLPALTFTTVLYQQLALSNISPLQFLEKLID